jgi:hypothetical protein
MGGSNPKRERAAPKKQEEKRRGGAGFYLGFYQQLLPAWFLLGSKTPWFLPRFLPRSGSLWFLPQ